MRIIFLNCWNSRTGKVFLDFVEGYSLNIDIFCFQEVQPGLFRKLSSLLPDCNSCYAGQKATFVNKNIIIISSENGMNFVQDVEMGLNGDKLYIVNIHGKARPGHKLDTPTRLRQSKVIINFFKDKHGPKIIGGDFNLLPETKSVQMFEEAGYKNLIKDYKIKTTRNMLAWGTLKKSEEKQYFADYVFTSFDVKVKNFEVHDIEISDHLPLILSFEI